MTCYKNGGCGVYEMYSCYECPASKPEYVKKGDVSMTKEESLKLEKRCDKIMSGYLGEPCTVSMALTGKLKVESDDGDYITWNMITSCVDYVSHVGFYDDLVEKIKKVKECVEDNRDIFTQLIWSYNHRSELEA